MKFINLIVALSACAFNGVAAARPSFAEAESICGSLGVINITALGPNINPDEVRLCLEHPLGKILPAVPAGKVEQRSLADKRKLVDKRSCWYGQPNGCSKGYCYKSCGVPGSGEWCWTAAGDNGLGPWKQCKGDSQCSSYATCGGGGCKSCGCSC